MVRGRSTEGLPFPCKLLQCACQGDTKRRGPHTRAFYQDPGASRAAKPCLRQSRHPAKLLLSGSEISSTPHGSSLQDTNRDLSKFQICFFLRTIVLTDILIGRVTSCRVSSACACRGVTLWECFVWNSCYVEEFNRLLHLGNTKPQRTANQSSIQSCRSSCLPASACRRRGRRSAGTLSLSRDGACRLSAIRKAASMRIP